MVATSLFVKVGGCSKKILISDIHYIEADGDYCNIVCSSKLQVSIKYNVHKTLKIIQELLPSNFFRCHRSFIINTDLVEEILGDGSNGRIRISNKIISVSQDNWMDLKKCFIIL